MSGTSNRNDTPKNTRLLTIDTMSAAAGRTSTVASDDANRLPDLATLSQSSSSLSTPTNSSTPQAFTTPEKQKIMSVEERVKQAENFVTKIGLDWSQLGDKEKKRAQRAMSPDFSWSPSHGEKNRKDASVCFSEAFNDFLERLDLTTEGPTPEDSTSEDSTPKCPTPEGPTPEDPTPKGPRLKKQLLSDPVHVFVSISKAFNGFLARLYPTPKGPSLKELLLSDPAHVFFDMDKEKMDNYMVIRHQKSGICPLHSASLLQHYLHCKRAGNDAAPDHKVLDISTYIRKSLPEEDQRAYIKKGTTSFDSTGFFRQLTGTTLGVMNVVDSFDISSIHRRFQKYGEPMLIARCRTYSDGDKDIWEGGFTEEEYEHHARECKSKCGRRPALHSMVIIGAFCDDKSKENPKYWFLVQNFWRHKWFHLVDGDRLCSMFRHGPKNTAGVYYCDPGDNTALVDDFLVVVDANYSECEVEMEEGEGSWRDECRRSEPAEE